MISCYSLILKKIKKIKKTNKKTNKTYKKSFLKPAWVLFSAGSKPG